MPSDCKIELDRPNAVYFSGELVSGTIRLTTVKDKNVRNIKIIFLGDGKVKWDESDGTDSNGSSTTTHYKSHEVYVNNETHIRDAGVLPAGLHTYTFSIRLPAECPTSIEGKYGHVRYGLSLILDRSFLYNNVYHKPLTILKMVDLNVRPNFKMPVLVEETGSSGWLTFSKAKLFYGLRIPFGAFTPGQTIKYSVCINNRTKSDTSGYSLKFTQKITFVARSPRRKERQKKNLLVQQQSSSSCARLTKRIFEGQFRIPSVPPTTNANAIIRVEYQLKVTVHMSGLSSSTDLRIPIFIGNVPFTESQASYQVTPSAPQLSTVKTNPDMPPSYRDLNPPSYEEAMQNDDPFVDHDIDKHHRVENFRPLYPMYP